MRKTQEPHQGTKNKQTLEYEVFGRYVHNWSTWNLAKNRKIKTGWIRIWKKKGNFPDNDDAVVYAAIGKWADENLV